jgi:pSer/pThr/pTyr-binding forkhead associated (FHA) protein
MWLAFGTQIRELRDGEIVVGSGADADWRIATADLMPRHFTVTIYDLNASVRAASRDSVVVVNKKQLVGIPHLLNDGDLIAAGSGRFLFSEGAPRPDTLPRMPTETMYLVNESGSNGRPLLSRSTTLGRDASSTIAVNDPSVSRFHAEVRREAGGFALHSMGSAGTLLNERRVTGPQILVEGDVIEIARRRWRFTRVAPAAPPVPGPRDNPTGKQWETRAPETGTVDVVPEPATAGRRFRALAIVGILLAAAAVGFLLATRG